MNQDLTNQQDLTQHVENVLLQDLLTSLCWWYLQKAETLFFRHSLTRKMGEPLMVRAVQQDKKSIIQPGTILQPMETGFGNPGVQQSSPGVPPSLQALDALMLMVPSLQKARGEWNITFLFQEMNESLISPDLQKREVNFLKPCPTVMRIRSNKSYLYLMCSRGTKLSNSTNINTTRHSYCSFFTVTF